MKYWLLKSEPYVYGWPQMIKDGTTQWVGVRNYQASNNMKAMELGDLGFFYHSNKGKEIVGIVEVIKTYYPDHTDEKGRFGMVDVKMVKSMPQPVTLAAIKATPDLADMALVRQSRLSVGPVSDAEWALLCKMGGL
ncbi:MAG: EVE domain-containing protein [Alphaproteobacteria bacterium]|nr:EVE domain-containing protein [Alphaproteobacteria bacterium]